MHAHTLTNKYFFSHSFSMNVEVPAVVAKLSVSATTAAFILPFTLIATYALKSDEIKLISNLVIVWKYIGFASCSYQLSEKKVSILNSRKMLSKKSWFKCNNLLFHYYICTADSHLSSKLLQLEKQMFNYYLPNWLFLTPLILWSGKG